MKPSSTKTNNGSPLAFRPHPAVRNPHLQSLLTRYKPNATNLRRTAQPMLLQTTAGVRLQGVYSPHPHSRGLVLVLHGWLGCVDSNYVLAVGERLYQHNYSVFRLNLRDHGGTAHLNPEPFRGDLLDEVFDATQQIAQLEADKPFYLVGASLGGNFSLRLTGRHADTRIPNLVHTVAINPVLDPYRTTTAIDTGFSMYLWYFRWLWRHATEEKQRCFPDLYDLSPLLTARTLMEMTERTVEICSPYPDALTYFAMYTINPTSLQTIPTQTTILTAADDPIVPVADFELLRNLSPKVRVHISPHGGHVGYVDVLPLRLWLATAVLMILEHED